MVNLYEKHRWHLDPNRPPMTPPEVTTLSQTIGGLKRSKTTIANARQTLSRYEDRAEKKSDSGVMLNGKPRFIIPPMVPVVYDCDDGGDAGRDGGEAGDRGKDCLVSVHADKYIKYPPNTTTTIDKQESTMTNMQPVNSCGGEVA